MCHFITIILPQDADTRKLKPIFESYKLDFRLIDDLHLAEQINKGDLCVQTARGMCDCGTILGSIRRDSYPVVAADEELYAKSIERFRKKGWSEDHIKNWVKKAKEEYFLRSVKRKFKGKNLSEAKLQKWTTQNDVNLQKYKVSETEYEKLIKSVAPQTEKWIACFTDSLVTGFTNRIGLLLHDYSGKHGNKIKIHDKEIINIKNLKPTVLLELREDVIYEFIP